MPIEQNNESTDSNSNSKRVWKFKMLLVFGPCVLALISLIICVVCMVRISAVADAGYENAETMKGVIEQQRDLSETVIELSQRQEAMADEISNLESEYQTIQDEIVTAHPQLLTGRDPNAWPKKVYLTFDDGPSSNTADILDILKKYDVKATFFVVGKESESLKPLYQRIIDEGHTLGIHSYSHVYAEIYSSKDAFTEDLDKITELISAETGYTPTVFRFPGGSTNTIASEHIDECIDVLDSRGITYYDWNISTQDATNPALSAEEIVDNALRDINKYEEVMILMHDLGNKVTTVEALPTIIESLQSEGIPIVSIDESTPLIRQYIRNNRTEDEK